MGWENTKPLWYITYSADSFNINLIEYESYEEDDLIHARIKNRHYDTLLLSTLKLDKPIVSQPDPAQYYDYGDPDLILHAEMWSYNKQTCIDFIEEQKRNYIKILEEKINFLQLDIDNTKSCQIKETDV